MSSPRKLSVWKPILNKHLGHNWRKHFTLIAVTLECVNRGLKTGFLWDVGPSTTQYHLCNVVRVLKKKNLLLKDIHPIVLAGNVFIVNIPKVLETISDFKIGRRVFVDVSGQSPVLFEPGSDLERKCRDMITSLSILITRKDFDKTDSMCLDVTVEPCWCVPSLFGILSGYPVVYWYDTSACDTPDCLCGIPLYVYKLLAKTKGYGDFEIFSFSIPAAVSKPARRFVDEWFQVIAMGDHDWLDRLELAGERVEVSHVVL